MFIHTYTRTQTILMGSLTSCVAYINVKTLPSSHISPSSCCDNNMRNKSTSTPKKGLIELRIHGPAQEGTNEKAQPTWKCTRKATLKLQREKNTGLYGYSNYSKLLRVCIFTSVLMDVSLSLKKRIARILLYNYLFSLQ